MNKNRSWDKNKNKVLHFSGGRSSAYMTLKEWQKGDIVIFCDTGRESQSTYEFVLNFAENTGINVIWLWEQDAWERLIKTEKALPNRVWRKCTLRLKIWLARRYLRSIGIKDYTQCIGFRAEENSRIKDYKEYWKTVNTKFPLADNNTKGKEIGEYWNKTPWGLHAPAIDSNCDGCFLKGVDNLIKCFSARPWTAEKWIKDEIIRGKGSTFIKGISYYKIFEASAKFNYYPSDLHELRSAYSCSCNA